MSNTATLETLHCTTGNHPFTRERTRGRKPKECPECAAKTSGAATSAPKRSARTVKGNGKAAKAPKAAEAETAPRRRRRSFTNVYTLSDDPVEDGGKALFLHRTLFSSEERLLKYAKEVVVDSIDKESGMAYIDTEDMGMVPTKLANLSSYSVERVEVTNEQPETETFEGWEL